MKRFQFGQWLAAPAVLLLGCASTTAHIVEQIYADWREDGDGWDLEVQFDAGYAMPETRDDPALPPPSRDWLLERTETEWAVLRQEAERYLRDMLTVESGGLPVSPVVSFPDWTTVPPAFPRLLNEVAYFRVVFSGRGEGSVEVAIPDGPFPKLAIGCDGDRLLLLVPGSSLVMREKLGEDPARGRRAQSSTSYHWLWAFCAFAILGGACWRLARGRRSP